MPDPAKSGTRRLRESEAGREAGENRQMTESNRPRYKVGDRVFRKADPFDVETITRGTTIGRGVTGYYTLLADGRPRIIPLPEDWISLAGTLSAVH